MGEGEGATVEGGVALRSDPTFLLAIPIGLVVYLMLSRRYQSKPLPKALE